MLLYLLGAVVIALAGTFYIYAPTNAGLFSGTILASYSGAGTITIGAGNSGVYRVSLCASSSSSHAGATVHWALHVGSTLHNEVSAESVQQNASDISPIAAIGIVNLNAGDVLTMQVTSDHAGDVITVNHADLTVNRIKT